MRIERFLISVEIILISLCSYLTHAWPWDKNDKKTWTCSIVQPDQPLTPSNSAFWRKENCTTVTDGSQPFLVVNSLHVDMLATDIRIVPGYSQDPSRPLIPIGEIAATYGSNANKFIAGINGGYFWRVDITGFWMDDVCRGKTRKDAELPVDDCSQHPNNGLHDGTLIFDGKVVGCNCDKWGYSRPALLATTQGNSEWNIKVLSRGEQATSDVKFALAAGPNLVSFNQETGASFIDIPDGEDNINRFEHAAQTAVGLNFAEGQKVTKMTMVTSDGRECGPKNTKCGVADPDLALLMQQHFGCQQAMSMDQGGSTTMWVNGAKSPNNDGVVTNAGGSARNVANGLYIQAV